ncbi:MAG: hypothetical protein KDA24_23125, partial [Deltaproteobacteria bacterium]|nr:hypothetical protein [Deltaproteobacteria bacterium]
TELEVTPQSGARLKDRESGQPPRLVAWSYEDKKTVPAPFEALVDRMRSADPNEGLVAYLLARDLDLARITPALADLVHDPNVPHPTRVHAAAALHAQGDGRADSLILATARGTTGPGPLESPLLFGAEGAGPKAVRSWAVAILPITHPEVAPDVLLSVVRDPDVGSSANTALAEGPWPTADWTVPALFRAAHDLDREPKERAAASRLLAVNAPTSDAEAPEEHPLWAMYSWLSADPDPQVHKPILQALPSLADDVAIPRLAGVLRSTDATDAQLRDAAWGLARRSWSSKVAVEALLQIAGDPDGGPSAAAALATLWRIDDPRVSGILIHAAATAGATGEAALHSAFIAARRSNDREAWVIGLDRLPPRKDRVGQALRRTLGVLDPKRIVWAP